MTLPPILLTAIPVGVLGLAGSLVLVARMRQQRRVAQRLTGLWTPPGQRDAKPDGPPLLGIVAALGGAVARSGILSAKTMGELEQTLVSSGLQGRNGISIFIGTKLLLLAVLPVLPLLLLPGLGLSTTATRTAAIVAAVVGLLLPDMAVRRNRRKYLERVDAGVADTLDMLVICAQAGLGLETALQRVAAEIKLARPDIAAELEMTLQEMRIAVDTKTAIVNLGVRTGLPSLKRFTGTLVQTLHYGTPLSDALRVLSAEMRQELLTKFEARAARLPVLLTMPMIIFIFPCIFIVMVGPSAIQIGRAFSH
jgi:tight adherence protein C